MRGVKLEYDATGVLKSNLKERPRVSDIKYMGEDIFIFFENWPHVVTRNFRTYKFMGGDIYLSESIVDLCQKM